MINSRREWLERKAALEEIRRCSLRALERPFQSPREEAAKENSRMFSVLFAIAVYGLGTFWVGPGWAILSGLVAAALGRLVSYLVLSKIGRKPSTIGEELGRLIAQYEPVDCRAYEHLRDRCRAEGIVDPELVQDWMVFEGGALDNHVKAVAYKDPGGFI